MIKKITLVFLAAFLLIGVRGRSQVIIDSSAKIITPDKMPEYKKGINGWLGFLESNLDNTLLQRQGAPNGKYTVIASFLIGVDGSVSDIRIEYDKGYGTADEVKRIIKLTDKQWKPALEKNQPVAFRHRQSITFVNN